MRDRLALPVIGLVSTVVVLSVGFLLLGRHREIQRAYDVSALPTLNAFLTIQSRRHSYIPWKQSREGHQSLGVSLAQHFVQSVLMGYGHSS